jgi:hypothetical protein
MLQIEWPLSLFAALYSATRPHREVRYNQSCRATPNMRVLILCPTADFRKYDALKRFECYSVRPHRRHYTMCYFNTRKRTLLRLTHRDSPWRALEEGCNVEIAGRRTLSTEMWHSVRTRFHRDNRSWNGDSGLADYSSKTGSARSRTWTGRCAGRFLGFVAQRGGEHLLHRRRRAIIGPPLFLCPAHRQQHNGSRRDGLRMMPSRSVVAKRRRQPETLNYITKEIVERRGVGEGAHRG